MHLLLVIGHLGADAVVQSSNGVSFLSLRVAVSEKIHDEERTTWYNVVTRNFPEKLLPYLTKGSVISVYGTPSYRIYDSQHYRCKMIDVTINARQIDLVSSTKQRDDTAATQTADPLPSADDNVEVF